jgi:type II secretory pathway pseudopilin PulG
VSVKEAVMHESDVKRRAALLRVPARRNGEDGYILLALIIMLAIGAVALGAAVPNIQMQAKRQREIEMYYRGDQMAEAIARYYTGGKLSPAGLIVRTPPPPYGFLTELRKLLDGVSLGSRDVYFVRKSAFIDPLTGQEWEPVRIGDPRLRKFFRTWQSATGRQVPPIYASYLGGNIVDTSPQEEGAEGSGDAADPQTTPGDPGDTVDGDDSDEDDDWDDEDDDWDDEDEEDGGDAYKSTSGLAGGAAIVRASYQLQKPLTPSSGNTNTPQIQRPGTGQPGGSIFSNGSNREGPIIGVVSKAKGTAIRTRFGAEKYEEMLFIYIPEARTTLPGQAPGAPNAPGTTPQTLGTPPPTPAGDQSGPGEDPGDGGSDGGEQ